MTKAPESTDTLIIGGGIVGLATAYRLRQAYPQLAGSVTVIDKEDQPAAHQTGHNSGVIHSGIYYRPGSLKAQLAVHGSKLMHDFCDAHEIPVLRCGKVIVATKPEQLDALAELHRRGKENGVPNLKILEGEQIRSIEPEVSGVRAIHVPGASSVNYRMVTQAMLREFESLDGHWVSQCRALKLQAKTHSVIVETDQGTIQAKRVIVCAGAYSDRLAAQTGAKLALRIVPFRGEYLTLRPERKDLVNGLIYPVPEPSLPFLGVHLTRTVTHTIEAGPNAVLALSREGYRRGQFSLKDTVDTLTFKGFWRLALRYWRIGLYEELRSLSRTLFLRSLQQLVPAIQANDLRGGPSGVRAQVLTDSGSLLDDFKFVAQPRILHVVNAPSPAATASLAIAEKIVQEFVQKST